MENNTSSAADTVYPRVYKYAKEGIELIVIKTPKEMKHFPQVALYSCCERHLRFEAEGAGFGYGFSLFTQKETKLARAALVVSLIAYDLKESIKRTLGVKDE